MARGVKEIVFVARFGSLQAELGGVLPPRLSPVDFRKAEHEFGGVLEVAEDQSSVWFGSTRPPSRALDGRGIAFEKGLLQIGRMRILKRVS